MFTLLTMPLRSRRDAVLARQRARRVASLLQFEGHEQALVVAAAFAVASQALQAVGPCDLHFGIEHQTLHVAVQLSSAHSSEPKLLRFARALPARQGLAEQDLAWVANQLPLLEPSDFYGEMLHQNQEMLGLLQALQVGQPTVSPAERSTSAA